MKQLHQLPDELLLNKFMSGSEEALNTLITRYKGSVKAYVLRITKNKEVTDDILQDTFIKVVHSLENKKYREDGKFLSWIIRIAHNLIIDHYRNKKKPHILSEDYDYDILATRVTTSDNNEEGIVDDQMKLELGKLVESLPKEQREIIRMRYFWGLSFKEISEQTNVSINTSLGRMRYALINLRKKMK